MTCPYAFTCLASRLPGDSICQDCQVVQRAPVEAVDGTATELLAATQTLLDTFGAWHRSLTDDADPRSEEVRFGRVYDAYLALRAIVEPRAVAAVERDGEVTP